MVNFLHLILMCLATTKAASEVQYIIIPSSQSQNHSDPHSSADSIDNHVTLSQFIYNSNNYLTNDTSLIFSPGNHSLELELVVENIDSFSMSAWPSSSSNVVITCGPYARFIFINITTVTVSGLGFVGCLGNYVTSVGLLQLRNSGFFGNGGRPIFSNAVLFIEESNANLDRMAFISVVETQATSQDLLQKCQNTNVIGIFSSQSNVTISQSLFEENNVGFGTILYNELDSDITISNTIFANNSAMEYCSDHCCFSGGIVYAGESQGSTVKIEHCRFVQNIMNQGLGLAISSRGSNMEVLHSTFVNNTEFGAILFADNTRKIRVAHCEFINNTAVEDIIHIDAVVVSISFTKFISNVASASVIFMPYYTTPENLTNNVFIDNSGIYEVAISTVCRPGFSLSLGNTRCIQCSENWRRDMIGIVIAAFFAGIALVIFMLALNMTVAVGTLNGILFYAHIIAANADTYFFPFTTPNFVAVFISWLSLDIGLDVCFGIYEENGVSSDISPHLHKAFIQFAFPTYVILLVIIVIVASECSSRFAKLIGGGNPVAVLATMILLSYAKFMSAIFSVFPLFYGPSAYGSRGLDFSRLDNIIEVIEMEGARKFKATAYSIIICSTIIPLLCIIYTIVLFSWQWLLRYQDKAIFKWVRYQKLHHFLEPYNAPYIAEYRYWTGLLLFVRILLHLISVMNFSLDTRVDMMAVILVAGGLSLLKGVIVKRVYKNWILDVIETAIYFNLVAFSALTWYNLDFGGNQVAAVYSSVMIIFILLLAIVVFHVLRYTALYKCPIVNKAFEWMSSKLLEKKPKQEPQNDTPEELDGYQLERGRGDDTLERPTYSVIELLNEPSQSQQ